ncbi:DUF3322 domain-containing protein [Cellvibrio japonicus]|uniref:Wadjet protein JetD C-terminal domain-containing protein n=1 Tax=Cellvibrio japonicus (strain Ueda107) TaxID=498211 RepID=B3PE78_CELJU|nr:DUF3322 domain-containing protein [Cellvibrio japonicus]ACE85510.1 conserved hypothetical protein [Cellvibrio japonicus Ueda107]QEI12120.1 hypothetical protein FY117_07730 [Cellvibrio japonicus]QEI15694.1 hypothetical protein FY116_07735 [Cellvibrio japonicus]QEI19272.1 hypothetical protein FY115_07730 [Cellvibrio japonicus]
MKSPADLSQRLARQWHNNVLREARLLSPSAWPLVLSIGRPTASVFAEATGLVHQHVQAWQHVSVGEVQWESVSYRAGADAVRIPVRWCLRSPSEWIAAAADALVTEEYAQLEQLIEQVDKTFHRQLVRQRALWLKKSPEAVIQTARLASRLSPGCAEGKPLRLLSGHGVDTKWIERNGGLLTAFLDERYKGAASEQGLITFLDALDEGDHWVLVAPLSEGLLPFKRQKVTTAELEKTALPGSRLLVVENEQCLHLLPNLPETIAILGAGLDLQWLSAKHLQQKTIGYWGDMDTWGLLMLARARAYCPQVIPLLMNQGLFDRYAEGRTVQEPVTAQPMSPDGLTAEEADFYQYLVRQPCGRFEQEFLPGEVVEKAVVGWANQ